MEIQINSTCKQCGHMEIHYTDKVIIRDDIVQFNVGPTTYRHNKTYTNIEIIIIKDTKTKRRG